MPDFPRPRDWGCVSCDAAFIKEKESVVDCFLEGTAEPFEDMESAMEEAETKVELRPKPEEIPFQVRQTTCHYLIRYLH